MADWTTALRRLVERSHRARPEDLPGLAQEIAPMLPASAIRLYLIDHEQGSLIPMSGPEEPRGVPLAVDTTMAGRAFMLSQVYESAPDGEGRLWVPMIDGMDRVGVIEVSGVTVDDELREACRVIAGVLAELIVSRQKYGDAIHRTKRRQPMQLAAEVAWNLLPPLTFATDSVVVSGILEPCYDIGGDTFDYAVNDNTVHLCLLDAVGHGVRASLLTALAVAAYRNARRCGLDLFDTYRSIDKWLRSQFPDSFVTGVLGELDARTGRLHTIAAGHPGGLLVRNGRLVKTIAAPTALPLGYGDLDRARVEIIEESLQPGDRVLLYTDGVVEARSEGGEFFGVQRLAGFVARAMADQLPTPETMRRLVRAILAHQHERLQDDATAVLLEWHGSTPR